VGLVDVVGARGEHARGLALEAGGKQQGQTGFVPLAWAQSIGALERLQPIEVVDRPLAATGVVQNAREIEVYEHTS
jgi:hypothetical protein